MRYHFDKPEIYLSMYGSRYILRSSVYNSCTLYTIGEKGLAVIQQRFDAETKSTWWSEVDPWITDALYLHPIFGNTLTPVPEHTDGLYPTVTVRQIMWALKMKPIERSDGKQSLTDGNLSSQKIASSFTEINGYLKGVKGSMDEMKIGSEIHDGHSVEVDSYANPKEVWV